jgi:hypothetical protein
MQITKGIFDKIAPNEIFRVVSTKIAGAHSPNDIEMTFVCAKGKSGIDWAIYAGPGSEHPNDIARYGDKIIAEDNIRNICPCDEQVFNSYRH